MIRLLAFLYFFSGTVAAQVLGPNGLCLIELRSGEAVGYGQGFISNGALHSSAHVLKRGVSRVFCIQKGVLVEVTEALGSSVEYNQNYVHSAVPQERSLSSPVDYGRIRLKLSFESDFVIDSFKNAGQKVANDKTRGIDENPWFRARMELDLSSLQSDLSNFDIASFFVEAFIDQLEEDVIPVSFEMPPEGEAEGMVLATTEGWESKPSVMFLDDTLFSTRGHSGSPLFQKLQDGTLLVSGIASAVGTYLDGLSNELQTVYTLAMNFEATQSSEIQSAPVYRAPGKACEILLRR